MLPQTTRRFLTLLPAACGEGPAAPATAPPAFSTEALQKAGVPGSIVFHSDRAGNREIYAMNPDGTTSDIMLLDLQTGTTTNLTNSPGSIEDWARFSPSGQQIAYHSNATGDYEVHVLDLRSGVSTQVTSYEGMDRWPDWSPNGKRLAIRRDKDIYVLDLVTGDVTRLTYLPSTIDQMAAWSPDGQQLAFMSFREGYCAVFLMDADGSGQQDLTPGAASTWCSRAPSCTRAGQILFMSVRPAHAGNVEVYLMNPDGTGVNRLTSANGEDGGPPAR